MQLRLRQTTQKGHRAVRNFQSIACVVFAAVLGACAQQGLKPAPQLRGTSWQLNVMGDHPALPPRPMLSFDQSDNVTGQASCNRYSAQVTISGQAITFGPIAATRMACGDAIDAQESAYFDRLGKATRIDIEGDILKIFSGDDTAPLLFVRAPAP
jgi:heat shock protein HslJ